jgi:hypothetical protein
LETVDLVKTDWVEIRAKLVKEEKSKKNTRDTNRRIQSKRQSNRKFGADGVKITERSTKESMDRMYDMTHRWQ